MSRETGYRDITKSPKERAHALLAELTLDEKMAQLTCISHFGDGFDDIEQQAEAMPYGIGQVSTLEMRRIHTLDEAASWQRKMQETKPQETRLHPTAFPPG